MNPASSAMNMLHATRDSWMFMLHGQAFLTNIQQTGPRGADKLFSTNWFMGSARHRVGDGDLQVRAMLSLEPATITGRRYPLLFQTGETAYGVPIEDAQHPHDLLMELSVEYARPIGSKALINFYAAPVGDPALGPVAFPHRVSALEFPQAPLSHHWQDSTHIANEVFTAGVQYGIFRLEASGFHGGEPDENRWNIDHGAVDSWSSRLWVSPTRNLNGQISVGRLAQPEAGHPGDVVRSTASITYNRPLTAGYWATSLIWGRNHNTFSRHDTNAYLAESVWHFADVNYLDVRIEAVQKDELVVPGIYRIGAYTAGYSRDVPLVSYLITGLGANVTAYDVPPALSGAYGTRPMGFAVFVRVRLKGM